jgi:hypothetical protein
MTSKQSTQTPIRILQMDCPTEEALLRKKLGELAGVTGMESGAWRGAGQWHLHLQKGLDLPFAMAT